MQQMEQLGEELDRRRTSKNKYKALLQEEKEKNAMLQEQLTQSEKQLEETKAEWKKKVDVLQEKNTILQVGTAYGQFKMHFQAGGVILTKLFTKAH